MSEARGTADGRGPWHSGRKGTCRSEARLASSPSQSNHRQSAGAGPGQIPRADAGLVVWFTVVLLAVKALTASDRGADAPSAIELREMQVEAGELAVTFRDNTDSPKILSGVDRLIHRTAAPEFDAFDPHDPGSSAGLNFEHIMFKFKVGEQVRRPAWDFQYVIHRVETGRQYGYRGRRVWKKFVSLEDCLEEYTNWVRALPAGGKARAAAAAPTSGPITAATMEPGVQTGDPGWRLPPQGPVTRTTPRLVNYFHMDLPDGRTEHKAERLAQWNVVILNHDLVAQERLSLARMRATNPRLKLLAWVPLQGPNRGLAKGVPAEGERDWYARATDGTYLSPHWGGHLMNVCVQDHAWPRHVLAYLRRECLRPGGYDGVMLDCLWAAEPGGHDANGDRVHDARDTAAWQEGMLFLLRQLRGQFPEAIVVGNGGVPWPVGCPYYEFVNGCMHENALGDQFGGMEWRELWEACQRALSQVSGRPAYHFVQADVRAEQRSQGDAAGLRTLTPNDHRRFRLGLATSLLLDGVYFGFDRGDCLHGQLWWFDEYDVNLGAPLGALTEGRYGPGTLARDFERGLVVVNPTEASISLTNQAGLTAGPAWAGPATLVVPPGDALMLPRSDVSVR